MVAVVLRLRKQAIKVYDISCNKQKKRDNYTLSSCVRASAAACLNRYYNMWLVTGHFAIPKWTKALLISLTHLLWTNPPLFCQCALDRAFLSFVLGLTGNAIIWSLTYKMWVVQQENPHSTSATHNFHGANQWWRYRPPAPCPRWRSFYAVFCMPPSSARVKSWRSHQWTWRSIWRFPPTLLPSRIFRMMKICRNPRPTISTHFQRWFCKGRSCQTGPPPISTSIVRWVHLFIASI